MLLPELPKPEGNRDNSKQPLDGAATQIFGQAAAPGKTADHSPRVLNRTMIGLAPTPDPKRGGTDLAAASNAPSSPGPSNDLRPARPVPAAFQTMLGMSPPTSLPTPANQASKTLSGAGAFTVPEPRVMPLAGSNKGTLIGVAIPGIAPVSPGIDKPRLAPVSNEELTHQQIENDSWVPPPDVTSPAPEGIRRYVVMSLAVAAGLLAAIAFVAIWWWRSSPKLEVQVRTDDSGRDSLELSCQDCDDASEVALSGTRTTFKNHQATISLKSPLKMGDNALQLDLSRRRAKAEAIQIHVPVDYRVVGDISTLGQNPAVLRLLIEKSPSVVFEVEKQPVPFDAAGRGRFDIDVSRDLIGPANVEKLLERRVAYSVRSPTTTIEGGVLLRTGILPLTIEAPSSLYITEQEQFNLCGTTAPNGQVDVAGLKVKVEVGGRFCHPMLIKEFGKYEIWVTTAASGFAPRKVRLNIERTPSLKIYARNLFKALPHEIANPQHSPGNDANSLVAITGRIVELSESPPVIRFLLQYSSKRGASGFARITSSYLSPMAAGTRVTVFGLITGSHQGPDGREMGELAAAFIVPALQ